LDKYEGIDKSKKDNKCDEIIKYNDDICLFVGSFDECEKKLDMECGRYNKFTKSNPAEHIKYDKTNKNYIYEINQKKITKKDIKDITDIVKEKIKDDFPIINGKIILSQKMNYKGKIIIIYDYENKYYFDINHVVNLFDDLKKKSNKYDQYKNKIELYQLKDNQFGGFYVKELISEETFYDMILNTNSIFTKQFKSDITKMLIKLRKHGLLGLNNDTLEVNIKKAKSVPTIDHFDKPYTYTQTYNNIQLVEFVNKQIQNFKKVNIGKYHKLHIMYLCIITFVDPLRLNRIICKIGYTCDIIDRICSLKNEYKCKCYLIALKTIVNIKDELEFHKLLRTMYPELIVNSKINDTDKTELYVFDSNLYSTFLSYKDKVPFNDNDIKLEDDADSDFDEYVIGPLCLPMNNTYYTDKLRFEHEERMRDMEYDHIMKHDKMMNDKEIAIKKMDYDIEMKRMEIELIKQNIQK